MSTTSQSSTPMQWCAILFSLHSKDVFNARIVHGGRVRGTCGAIRVDMSVLILIIAYLRWRFHDLHGAEGFALFKPSLSVARSLSRTKQTSPSRKRHEYDMCSPYVCSQQGYKKFDRHILSSPAALTRCVNTRCRRLRSSCLLSLARSLAVRCIS